MHIYFSGEIIVSTTRPETILGDVAVAVHPDDSRYKEYIGRKLIHPFRKNQDENYFIPIVADSYVNPSLGTGAVKITPGHDQNDFEVGKRHNLPLLNVLSEDGTIKLSKNSTEWREEAKKLQGVPRFKARQAILSDLKKFDLFRGQKSHAMQIPVCSRTGDVIEPLLKPQWFLKTADMARDALSASQNGILKFEPEYYEKIWYNWLKNNQDWCLSRQLWWGHRIPIWRCKSKGGAEDVFVCAFTADEATSEVSKVLSEGKQESREIFVEQENDVLDTWFSSAILPFSIFGWPKSTEDIERYYPLSLMETGHDILFFWVARMVMLGQGKIFFNP